MSPTSGRVCLACRATVLSRYNTDPLCGPCQRASRDSKQIAPAWLWDSAPMRAALARVDLPAFVSIFRAATGLSQTELGNLVEGWSQSAVCRLEQGKLDIIYDIRRLLAFTDAVGMPRSALLPLILGDPDAILEGDDTVALREASTVDIDRRVFNTLAVGFAAAAVLPPPARVDRAHVRYLQAGLAQLRTQDHAVGGGAVLPETLRLFRQARAMLDESDYTEGVGRELLIVAADLGLESAWFAYDADNQPLARRLYQDAALLADSAGDSQQCVHLYANMAQQCTHLARSTGRPGFAREALRFADRAENAARHEPSPALHSLISLRRSLAHAQLGDEAAFRSTITAARRELDRGPYETDPTWTAFVRPSEITHYEAMGKARLGSPGQAVKLYHVILDDTARSFRDQALQRATLAETLVQAGNVDQAISQGMMVLPELGTTLTSGRILQRLQPVRDAANPTTAADFCDHFDTAARALTPAQRA